jgi:small GTP-binding protein
MWRRPSQPSGKTDGPSLSDVLDSLEQTERSIANRLAGLPPVGPQPSVQQMHGDPEGFYGEHGEPQRSLPPSSVQAPLLAPCDELQGASKVVLCGNGGVGKTSLLRRARTNTFAEHEPVSIGVAMVGLRVLLPGDERPRTLQVWDTAGQERFNAMTQQYFRGAVVAIVVFSLTDRRTFDAASGWLRKAREALAAPAGAGPTRSTRRSLLLVGNKRDLPSRAVTEREAAELAEREHATYHECAAATGVGVDILFGLVANGLPESAGGGEGGGGMAVTSPGLPTSPGTKSGRCCGGSKTVRVQ